MSLDLSFNLTDTCRLLCSALHEAIILRFSGVLFSFCSIQYRYRSRSLRPRIGYFGSSEFVRNPSSSLSSQPALKDQLSNLRARRMAHGRLSSLSRVLLHAILVHDCSMPSFYGKLQIKFECSLVELNYPSWVPFSTLLAFPKHRLPPFPRFSR